MKTKKIDEKLLKKMIREELSRGIPDFALHNIAEKTVEAAAEDLLKSLILNANQTATDPFIRNRRYAAANLVISQLKRDREFTKTIEDKLKEALVIYLQKAV